MARLRGPAGCPWDREQTHASLRPYVLEEAYEVVDAIDRDSPTDLSDELGDLLLQVVFHAQLADETGTFSIVDVVEGITRKLERRHPHVFGELQVDGTAEVVRNWQDIKASERASSGSATTLQADLAAIPHALPALARAEKVASRAARHGLGWPHAEDILDKIAEELTELRGALRNGEPEAVARELGDLLLAAASFAKRLGISSELALSDALGRFTRRAADVEAQAAAHGTPLARLPPEQRDDLWDAAKRRSI